MNRILLADDDIELCEMLQEYLEAEGFQIEAVHNGEDALERARSNAYDLLVLDVMMPGEDGLSLTRSLRETMQTPILLLTAKGETGNRIEGLEAGADDYLPKPFEPKELLLRINAILRRMPDTKAEDAAPKVMSLGAIRYDLERGEMWHGDELVRLTATEIQLMKIFSAEPGSPLSRAKLVEELGRDRGQAQERAVDVQITRLRRKIEDNPKQPRYLQTVRGAGYMLAPD